MADSFFQQGVTLKGKDWRRALNYQAHLQSHQPSKDRGENMGTQGRANRALCTCTQETDGSHVEDLQVVRQETKDARLCLHPKSTNLNRWL